MLVHGYLGMSDAEMIELTVLDLRLQMDRRGSHGDVSIVE
jgi:hypothetical protein